MFLKKLVVPFFYPLPVCIEILLAGLLMLWFTRWQRAGKWVLTIGVVLLVVIGEGALTSLLLKPLESRYAPLDPNQLSREATSPIKWIVVLTGVVRPDPLLPPSSRLNPASLQRLVEGIRLHRALQGSKLVLSGRSPFGPVPDVETMVKVVELLGVDPANVLMESTSRDTAEQARLTEPIVKGDRFVLVTSASHMPRALALFEKRGMHPLPAPTDYHISFTEETYFHPGSLFPSPTGFRLATLAVHEYLGMAWAKLRGQV